MAYTARIITGFGVSFATISYLKAVSVWFPPRKFAFAASFLATAAMIGALSAQAPLAYLIKVCGSWKTAILVFAIISFIIGIIYYIVVRDLNPSRTDIKNNSNNTIKSFGKVINNKNNWILTLYVGLSFTAVDAFAGFWGNAYFRESYNISKEEAATVISMIFIGMAIGSPIIGKLSDIFDQRKALMIIFHILGTISISLVLLTTTTPILSGILLFIFGLCLGIYMLAFTIASRVNPIAITATVAAFINTGEPLLGAIFDPLIGILLDWSWTGNYINKTGEIVSQQMSITDIKYFEVSSYQFAFSTIVLSMILSLVMIIMIKDKKN